MQRALLNSWLEDKNGRTHPSARGFMMKTDWDHEVIEQVFLETLGVLKEDWLAPTQRSCTRLRALGVHITFQQVMHTQKVDWWDLWFHQDKVDRWSVQTICGHFIALRVEFELMIDCKLRCERYERVVARCRETGEPWNWDGRFLIPRRSGDIARTTSQKRRWEEMAQ